MLGPYTFPAGGFVCHRITGAFRGVVSAWFDADGNPLDAEQRTPDGRYRPVKKGGPIWQRLAVIGRRHKHSPGV
jgi:hypothetical protein